MLQQYINISSASVTIPDPECDRARSHSQRKADRGDVILRHGVRDHIVCSRSGLICEALEPKNSAELRAGSGPVVVSVAAAARHMRRGARNANDPLDVQTGLGMLAAVMQR